MIKRIIVEQKIVCCCEDCFYFHNAYCSELKRIIPKKEGNFRTTLIPEDCPLEVVAQ